MKRLNIHENINLSEESEQILLGSILGDGYLGNSPTSYYSEAHCLAQLDYLYWKKEKLNLPFGPDNNMNDGTSIQIRTRRIPKLNEYRKLFYPNGKKIVTREILDKLTPLAIAVWYMDDGSIQERKLILCTQGFGYDGNLIIQQYFKDKHSIHFRIDSYINKDYNRTYHRLVNDRLPEISRFINMVKPYILPVFEYKTKHLESTIFTAWTPLYKKIWDSTWRHRNKEHIKMRDKVYNRINRERILTNKKIYYQKNKDKWKIYKKTSLSKRRNIKNSFTLIFGKM